MGFEWDPVKANANRQKHGISFLDAADVFLDSRRVVEETTRPEHGEQRFKATGIVNGRLIAVIFTVRNENTRIISARRVRPDEQRRYDQGKV